MNSDSPASFQLPPGSKVTIAYPDAEGNCGTQDFNFILSLGQQINVSASNLTVEPPVDPFATPVGFNIDDFEFSPSDFEYYPSDEEEGLLDDSKDLPVSKYLAFARPAHPNELLWDHTRGTGCVYAITRGRRVGLFWDWEVVRDLTFSVPNASFQKFETIDDAMQWYTAGYDNELGHANLAVVAAHRLPKEPIVDDNLMSVRGQDLMVQVTIDGAVKKYKIIPVREPSHSLPATPSKTPAAPKTPTCRGLTASQVLSPARASASPGFRELSQRK
ncbi:hypothetical protein K435DRAFT_854237 [Dendrothele bispora CBS 962.96]|uniref:Ribonuclease H1 N-terminal domain-containing protein n=1 Tax=Dendrothele bispora (strain CBS 962.96) TaxID=1314807 RepID=A0A4S8MEE2_DENBC|nr:hypothetical protein K435DRAFT_854237 [Dendrothele bispora CBS 962.96]